MNYTRLINRAEQRRIDLRLTKGEMSVAVGMSPSFWSQLTTVDDPNMWKPTAAKVRDWLEATKIEVKGAAMPTFPALSSSPTEGHMVQAVFDAANELHRSIIAASEYGIEIGGDISDGANTLEVHFTNSEDGTPENLT